MGAVKVSQVSKAYKSYPSKWSRLAEWLLVPRKARHTRTWVLKNIDFEVAPGEALGIIGLNGAGKSTLLKIITGTTIATSGTVSMRGSVAALLELGMGFHPDFTGRQNVYMSGQLLGLSIREIESLMQEIERFAEIGEYIDRPVRVYSSGMQVRLAFAVATARRPDILIVDEALSVGDAYFQHKSFERIRSFRKQGTTLLLVSHDKFAIQSICDRAILLNAGEVAMNGDPESVLDLYNALISGTSIADIHLEETPEGKVQVVSGGGQAICTDYRLTNSMGAAIQTASVGEVVRLELDVKVIDPVAELVAGFTIKDRLGQAVFGTNTFYTDNLLVDVEAGRCIRYVYEFPMNIGEGSYSVSFALHGSRSHIGHNYEWRDLAMMFEVINADKPHFVGNAFLSTKVNVLETP